MANDFYQHSGWPGTRALNASAAWRSEFGLIEDGFDKMPDVSTANLFAVTDGSALVGKTAAQSKVILSLSNVPNLDTTAAVAHTSLTNNPHSVTKAQVGLGSAEDTADADKPISTLTQAALNLKADLADFNLKADLADFACLLNADGYITLPVSGSPTRRLLIQWGGVSTHATANTATTHSFPLEFAAVYSVVGCLQSASAGITLSVWSQSTTGFQTICSVSSKICRYVAIGSYPV